MRRDLLTLGVLWIGVSLLLILLANRVQFFPFAAAREAAVADSAFRLLLLMAAPVFALVLAVLVYSLMRFRGRGDPPEDAPYVREHPGVARAWFVITSALAIYVMYNPGLVGIAEMRGEHSADLVVRVEAARFFWKFSYPQYGIDVRELVLPRGRRVRFEVTAVDVLHSFWVPAFRTKIDAVPGMTTTLHVTPTAVGSTAEDFNIRVQCAELCGAAHDVMRTPVRIVNQADFDAWTKAQKPRAERGR